MIRRAWERRWERFKDRKRAQYGSLNNYLDSWLGCLGVIAGVAALLATGATMAWPSIGL